MDPLRLRQLRAPSARTRATSIARAALGGGFLTAFVVSARLATNAEMRSFLESAVGTASISLVVVTTLASALYLRRDAATRPFVTALIVSGTGSALFLIMANEFGWLGGPAFTAPLPVPCSVYGLATAVYVAAPLGLYTLVVRRSRVIATGVFAGALVTSTWVTSRIAANLVDDGTFVLDYGYTVFWDTVSRVALTLVALVIFETSNRDRRW